MTHSSFLLWLAWALFAAALLFVIGFRYLREVRASGPLRSDASERASGVRAGGRPTDHPRPWLYCEDGSPVDKRAAWFALRAGGTTVIGHQPRPATERAAYVYLAAHDLDAEQATIRFDRAQRRYVLEPMNGTVRHNNEPLAVGTAAPLTDGDTVDLGEVTRLRFTFTPPPEAT
jgi:hypothetical protein